MRIPRTAVTAGLVATVTSVLLAQKPAINVRVGLWETTTTMSMGGDMAGMMGNMDMSKMTDQQKAAMAQAMGQMSQMMGKPQVHQACITQKDFDSWDFAKQDKADTCKHTIAANTATTVDY